MNDAASRSLPLLGDVYHSREVGSFFRLWHYDYLGEMLKPEKQLLGAILQTAALTFQCEVFARSGLRFVYADLRRRTSGPRLRHNGERLEKAFFP